MSSKKVNVHKLTDFLSNYTNVEQEEIDVLERMVDYRTFQKKEIVHQQGEVQKYLGFVLKGAIRFYHTDVAGNEDTFEFVFENLPIGQYNTLLSQEVALASAQAMEPTELIIISKDEFLGFMSRFPKYYPVIAEVMGNALMTSIARTKLSKIASARERYEEFCKQHAQNYQRIPLTYVASYLNMTLSTLSRVRAGKL